MFDSTDINERVLLKSRRQGAAPLPNNSCLHHKVCTHYVNTVEMVTLSQVIQSVKTPDRWTFTPSLQCLSMLYLLQSPFNWGLGKSPKFEKLVFVFTCKEKAQSMFRISALNWRFFFPVQDSLQDSLAKRPGVARRGSFFLFRVILRYQAVYCWMEDILLTLRSFSLTIMLKSHTICKQSTRLRAGGRHAVSASLQSSGRPGCILLTTRCS